VPVIVSIAAVIAAVMATLIAAGETYNRDVQPILQRACVACHSPGQIAPMSFTTYESTRPWAPRIKAVVTQKKMPPGVVERHYGLFGDDGALHQHDIDIIVQWVDGGAPEK
jgi:hypothetical protein